MSTRKYDVKNVSRDTLEKLAQRVLDAYQSPGVAEVTFKFHGNPNSSGKYLVEQLVIEAEVPLRTKAEVDTELSAYVRSFHKKEDNYSFYPDYDKAEFRKKIEELVNEETVD